MIPKAPPRSNVPSLVSLRLATGAVVGLFSLGGLIPDAGSVPEGLLRMVRFVERAVCRVATRESGAREVMYSAAVLGMVGEVSRVGEACSAGARGWWNEVCRGI